MNASSRLRIGIAATVLGLAPAVPFAQSPPPAPERPGMQGPHEWHGGMRMMRDVERLKTSLRLDASQTALWDRAVEQSKPPAGGRERWTAGRDRMAAMLDDPSFDPRAFASEIDRQDGERRTRMVAMRDAWFAVWDRLDVSQRGQVREFMRTHLGRRGGPGR